MADVVFPLETHAEKDGTVTHPDGRLQRVRPSAWPPRRHPPELGRPRRAVSGPRPRHRHHLPALRLRRPRRRGPVLRRHRPTPTSAAAASAGKTTPRCRERLPESARPPGQGRRTLESPDTQRDSASAGSSGSRPPSPGRSLALGTYRDLWAGPITELNPPLKFLAPAAARRDLAGRRRAPGPEDRRRGPGRPERHQRRGHGRRSRNGSRRASASCSRAPPTATPTPCSTAAPVERRDREGRPMLIPLADTAVRRSDLDHGRQVAGDLRRDLRRSCR